MTTETRARWIPAKDVAKLVRDELKRNFPNHRFSVRVHPSTLSIRVSWVDGPTKADVFDFVGHYHGSIDPETQTQEPSILEGERVLFGNPYLFLERDWSLPTRGVCRTSVAVAAGREFDPSVRVEVRVIRGAATPCGGASEYMDHIAKQLFDVTEKRHTRSKLEAVY